MHHVRIFSSFAQKMHASVLSEFQVSLVDPLASLCASRPQVRPQVQRVFVEHPEISGLIPYHSGDVCLLVGFFLDEVITPLYTVIAKAKGDPFVEVNEPLDLVNDRDRRHLDQSI